MNQRILWLPVVGLSAYGTNEYAIETGTAIAWWLEGSRTAGAEAILYGAGLLVCGLLLWRSLWGALPD